MRTLYLFVALLLCVWPATLPSQEATLVRDARTGTPLLRLRERMHIGTSDDERLSFGRVTDAKFGRDHSLYVVDDVNARVAVYGPDGRFRTFIGRKGRGPGEFLTPWRLAVHAADSVAVWDLNANLISFFDPQGRFVRSVRTPPEWLVNTLEYLPGGDLAVSTYEPSSEMGVHLVTPTGAIRRSFHRVSRIAGLGTSATSLLGGSLDVDGGEIVYSNKSPYRIVRPTEAGARVLDCVGVGTWTTPPAEVVEQRQDRTALHWDRYVHVVGVIALPGRRVLNIVRDPVNTRTRLDVVDDRCHLLARVDLPHLVNFTDRKGNLLIGGRSIEVPEVVVYALEPMGGE